MTPARKAALQWFHDRGRVWSWQVARGVWAGALTDRLVTMMKRDGQIDVKILAKGARLFLTDKGRRDLREAGR